MSKFIKRLKPLFSIAVACSLTVSSFLGVAQAEDSGENLVDYCLTAEGKIRDGVNITARYGKSDGSEFVYSGEQNSGADEGKNEGTTLNRVLTSTPDEYKRAMFGFYGGWKTDSIANTYYIQLDLGAVRDINQIELVPFANFDSGGDTYWRTGRIYLSNDEDFEDKIEITNGITLFESFKPNVFSYGKSDTKKYRYLRYCFTAGRVFAAAHLSVKGYCEDLFGKWDCTQAGTGYEISIPVEHFAGEKTYTVMSALYNDRQEMIGFNSERTSAVNGKLSSAVFSNEQASTIWCGAVNDANELIYAIPSYLDGNPPFTRGEAELNGSEFAEFSENDNVLTVNAKSDDPEKIITCIVLKNCDKNKTEEEYFNEIGENLKDSVWYAASGESLDGISFKIPVSESGLHYIKVTESGKNETRSRYFRFNMISNQEKEAFTNKVFSADGSDWKDIVSYYGDELELMSKSNLFDYDVIKNENFADTLVKTRDMLYADTEHTLSNTIELVNSAILLDAIYNKNYDAAGEYIEKDKRFSECVGDYAGWELYTKVLSNLIDDKAEPKETLRVLKSAAVLSYIQDATAAKIAEALKKYEKELDIDLSLCDKYDVNLERVCARLDNSKAYTYDNGKLKSVFEAAVKTEADQKSETTATTGTTGRKNGGSGGISVPVTTTKPNKPEVKPDNNENNGKTEPKDDEQVIKFADLEGFEWAEKNIYRLKKMNIVNGKSENIYEPQSSVTRAEFAKMIVSALDITANEKKEMHFIDCTGNDWFYPWVLICYSAGICNGVDEYHYNPNASITRQDMAVIISKAMALKGANITLKSKKCSEQTAPYAEEPFEKMIEAGIVNGYGDNTYRPYNDVTRAEAATIICNVIDYIKNGGIK